VGTRPRAAPTDPAGLEERLRRSPADVESILALARHHYEWGPALAAGARPSAPDDAVAAFRGRLDEWARAGEDVAPLRDLLAKDPEKFRALFLQREAEIARRMFWSATIYFRQARALGGGLSAEDAAYLGLSYFRLGAPHYRQAARFLEEAIAGGVVSARALTFLGNIAVEDGDVDRALDLYRRAREVEPTDPVVAFNLAWAHKEKGDLDAAARNLGIVLEAYGERDVLSEADLTTLLQARTLLGWIHLQAGRHREAISELQEVARRTPESPEVHYWLGKAYAAARRYEAARAHWEKVRAIDARYKDVGTLLARLPARS
jgi:tetratricopeptide (TPR) repeat protein